MNENTNVEFAKLVDEFQNWFEQPDQEIDVKKIQRRAHLIYNKIFNQFRLPLTPAQQYFFELLSSQEDYNGLEYWRGVGVGVQAVLRGLSSLNEVQAQIPPAPQPDDALPAASSSNAPFARSSLENEVLEAAPQKRKLEIPSDI